MDRLRGVPLTDLEAVRSITSGESWPAGRGWLAGLSGGALRRPLAVSLSVPQPQFTPSYSCCPTAAPAAAAVEPELVLINGLNTWVGSVVGCESFHAGECAVCAVR